MVNKPKEEKEGEEGEYEQEEQEKFDPGDWEIQRVRGIPSQKDAWSGGWWTFARLIAPLFRNTLLDFNDSLLPRMRQQWWENFMVPLLLEKGSEGEYVQHLSQVIERVLQTESHAEGTGNQVFIPEKAG
jgi:hypothetical protein